MANPPGGVRDGYTARWQGVASMAPGVRMRITAMTSRGPTAAEIKREKDFAKRREEERHARWLAKWVHGGGAQRKGGRR